MPATGVGCPDFANIKSFEFFDLSNTVNKKKYKS